MNFIARVFECFICKFAAGKHDIPPYIIYTVEKSNAVYFAEKTIFGHPTLENPWYGKVGTSWSASQTGCNQAMELSKHSKHSKTCSINHGLWNLPPCAWKRKKQIHGFWAWIPRSHCWKKGQLLHLFVPTLCTISAKHKRRGRPSFGQWDFKHCWTRGFSWQETTKNQTISTDVWGLLPSFKCLSDICVNLVCAGLRPNQKSHNFKVHAGEPV